MGENVGPAQWPDANRYMEALISRLCDIHTSPAKAKKKTVSRWTLICRDYANIVKLLMNCPVILRDTNMQMHDINNTTLVQWYNRTAKKREQTVLHQGIPAVSAPTATAKPIPDPVAPVIVHQAPEAPQHVFQLPPDTQGQAVTGRQRLPLSVPSASVPSVSLPSTSERYLLPRPPASSGTTILVVNPTPGPSADVVPSQGPSGYLVPSQGPSGYLVPSPSLSEQELTRKQRFHIRRKLKLAEQGIIIKEYNRKVQGMTCAKCGQPRTSDSGHRQYFGQWHCPTEDQSYEVWLDRAKKRRQEKKEQKKRDGEGPAAS